MPIGDMHLVPGDSVLHDWVFGFAFVGMCPVGDRWQQVFCKLDTDIIDNTKLKALPYMSESSCKCMLMRNE